MAALRNWPMMTVSSAYLSGVSQYIQIQGAGMAVRAMRKPENISMITASVDASSDASCGLGASAAHMRANATKVMLPRASAGGKEQGARSEEEGARSKEEGARSKEEGARSKEQ